MTDETKNPYKMDTPSWQLWERAKSEDLKAISYSNDAQRFTHMSAESREKAEEFRQALERLNP